MEGWHSARSVDSEDPYISLLYPTLTSTEYPHLETSQNFMNIPTFAPTNAGGPLVPAVLRQIFRGSVVEPGIELMDDRSIVLCFASKSATRKKDILVWDRKRMEKAS